MPRSSTPTEFAGVDETRLPGHRATDRGEFSSRAHGRLVQTPFRRSKSRAVRCGSGPRFPVRRRTFFTFLEILIAVAILGVALALALQIVGAARSRLLRAERRWARQHNLDQAVEFYLLAGPDAAPPAGMLPEGFSTSCTLDATPIEELPDFVSEQYQGWILARYRITLIWRGSSTVQEQIVEKVVRADAVP